MYPPELADAMLHEYLPFHGFWYAEEMLAARDHLLLLYDVFVQIERQIIGALLGLNRMYMPTPQHMKWMDDMIAGMAIKPDDLSARLKLAFRIEPARGVEVLNSALPGQQHAPSPGMGCAAGRARSAVR